MNEKLIFCLSKFAEFGTAAPHTISRAARDAGLNTQMHSAEWAHPYIRKLRRAGLISRTGQDRLRATIYGLTEEGRKALAEYEDIPS